MHPVQNSGEERKGGEGEREVKGVGGGALVCDQGT